MGRTATPPGIRSVLRGCLVTLLLTGVAAPVAAQYRLAPGDRLKVAVLGAAELSGEAEVDVDGKIRLPVFGAVGAAGRDVDEVQAALREAAQGRVFKRIAVDGAAAFISVEPDDVYASVVAYRPIYVTGSVGRGGGVVPFRPGMTVRVALASAGGVGEQTDETNPRFTTPRLRGEERTLSQEIGRLAAQLWRLDAEYAEIADPPSPSIQGVPVRPEVFDVFVADERARLVAAAAALAERRAYFTAAIAQADERIGILRAQRQNHVTAAELDAEEQARVETLFQRGVVPVARLLDTRRAQLLSSTRLLETDNNLERVELERVRFEGDAKIFEEERKRGLLDAMAQTRARIEAAGSRLLAVREELTLNGQAVLELDSARQTTTTVTIFRSDDVLADTGPDFMLEPGDVVDVAVEVFNPLSAIP